MKALLVLALLILPLGPTPMRCMGADAAILHAVAAQLAQQAPEHRLPIGEWCQRPTVNMSKRAHKCACHQHDCRTDPNDPANLSAHTDSHCLSYCSVANCKCSSQDCP